VAICVVNDIHNTLPRHLLLQPSSPLIQPIRARWSMSLAARAGALVVAGVLLTACAQLQGNAGLGGPTGSTTSETAAQTGPLAGLLPADVVLLGERHDAPGQPERVLQVVQALLAQQRLAALVMEMAPAGTTTIALGRDADAAAVQKALQWNERGWPWQRYAPAIMAAVRAVVPVVGGNLPDDHLRDAMADVSLDAQLPPAARAEQQDAIRAGHCNLLPEKQIAPMTRVQIARDRSMAHVIAESVVPGRTVVLWSGAGHANRALGVPQHLPTGLKVRAIRMEAGGKKTESGNAATAFDDVWHTPAMEPHDYCADFKREVRAKR
jgi:uncharacterized iron-regulated protein